jgi:magnesium-transporting ATPase (P-type)
MEGVGIMLKRELYLEQIRPFIARDVIKLIKSSYYIGLIVSMLFGVWHFFVPYIFQWYSYIPGEYENLIVGIDYTNFFFSLLLTGISLLLIVLGKKVFSGNKETLVFYGFLGFVWFCRTAITFIEPWPLEPVAWAAYGQQISAILVFVLLFIPFIWLFNKHRT